MLAFTNSSATRTSIHTFFDLFNDEFSLFLAACIQEKNMYKLHLFFTMFNVE